MKSTISEIDKNNLCLGCGICESIFGQTNVNMELRTDGFIHPNIKTIDKTKEKVVVNICPGINVVNDIPFSSQESIWGKVIKTYSTFSPDQEIRNIGSSGGTVSAVAIYLLETNFVDKVLQVRTDTNNYTKNTLQISKNRKDVLVSASSRYAPAHIFDNIINILESGTDTFCFIGKPCDISTLKNFIREFPQYKTRFKFTISIICAGIPSMVGTTNAINSFQPKLPIKDLKYRGGGWPGNFSFTDVDNKSYKMSYNDSWGKILGKHIHYRCKICPDGIGLQADLTVGDAWETKDGYPDFNEKEGQSLSIIRTSLAVKIIHDMFNSNSLSKSKELTIETLGIMRPFQLKRRIRVGARIIPLIILKRVNLNYKGLKIWKNMRKGETIELIKECIGSAKRLNKIQNG